MADKGEFFSWSMITCPLSSNISARGRREASLVPFAPRYETERARSPRNFFGARGVRGSCEFFLQQNDEVWSLAPL
jgi:hypothetical protein